MRGRILLFMLIICSTSIYTFDDERKGFIIGGGLGVGYLSNITSLGSLSETDSRIVFPVNLKIGYAPSNTLEIFYSSRISWWSDHNYLSWLGLGAVAFTLYFDNISRVFAGSGLI